MENPTTDPATARTTRFGSRNLAYLVFIVAVCALALVIEVPARGPGGGMGFIVAAFLWILVSMPFFIWNLFALFGALKRNAPARVPAIGAVLPVLCVFVQPPLVDGLWISLRW